MGVLDKNINGFSLTELLAAVSIVGILSAIALPNYSKQVERTHQSGMAAFMEQVLVRIVSSKEEIGLPPTSWFELGNQAAIMTKSGPVSEDNGKLDEEIAWSEGNYTIKRIDDKLDANYFVIAAENTRNEKMNVLGCIDLITGASDVKLGVVDSATQDKVQETDLLCR